MNENSTVEQPHSENKTPLPDVIVKFSNEVELPYIDNLEEYIVENGLAPWKELASMFPGISIRQIYVTLSSERIQELENRAFKNTPIFERPNLLKFFRIEAPLDTDLQMLADAVTEWDITELAYVPFIIDSPPDLPSTSALFQDSQIHLDPSLGSVGAEEAWLTPDADGTGIQFIDLERGWVLAHENFRADPLDPSSTVFSVADLATSQLSAEPELKAHGASVLGVIAAPDIGRNTIGIAFEASGQVVSIDRKPLGGGTANENIHDAITLAVSMLNEGDVLLIEAQASREITVDDPDYEVGKSKARLWPVEVNLLEYLEILVTTNLKIVVIEPAGNGVVCCIQNSSPCLNCRVLGSHGNDLDLFTDMGNRILNRNIPGEFREDSGAIMVGSAIHTYPHIRMTRTNFNSESNYGSRVDCYAWGEQIWTTGGPDPDDYNNKFGSTSGASAIIAGVALIVQSLAKANSFGINPSNSTYSPLEIRSILSDPANGTLSNDPNPVTGDRIGVMPDLVKIIDNHMNLGPDIYLRDFLGDIGDPHTGSISSSPDIIVRNTQVVDGDIEFGQGSSNQNLNGLGEAIIKDSKDKFIYIRVTNRGSTVAKNVQVNVYWSEVVTLSTPSIWIANPIGTVNLADIPVGEMRVAEIIWENALIPSAGHYCFVGMVGNTRDPIPDPSIITTWDEYRSFIRDYNNVTWCNFNVEEILPSSPVPGGGDAPGEPDPGGGGGAGGNGEGENLIILPFLATGTQFEDIPMHLEVDAQLPEGSQLWLEGPKNFMAALADDLEDGREKGIKRVVVNPRERHPFRSIPFPKNLREQMRLVANIPAESRQQSYEVFVRQLYKNEEVGRVTWRLVPPVKKEGNFLDDFLRWLFKRVPPLSCLFYLLLILGLLIIVYLYLSSLS